MPRGTDTDEQTRAYAYVCTRGNRTQAQLRLPWVSSGQRHRGVGGSIVLEYGTGQLCLVGGVPECQPVKPL